MKSTLFLFSLCCSALALSELSSQYRWFGNHQKKQFFEEAWSGFDKNSDGSVTIGELRLGIQSLFDLEHVGSLTFVPTWYTCIPRVDPVHFADAWVIAARQSNLPDSTVISFTQAVSEYFGTCSDDTPVNNTDCSDLVEANPMICSHVESECQISCFKCGESTLLGSFVRGTNGKFVPSVSEGALRHHLEQPEEDRIDNVGQYYHSDKCAPVNGNKKRGSVFWVSDFHTEPWYDVDGTNKVSRFKGAKGSNMWQCRDKKGHNHDCTLNGKSDPPQDQFQGVMDYIKKYQTVSPPLLLFVGDTDAHSFTKNVDQKLADSVKAILNKTFSAILDVSPPSHVVYTAGNNDASHDKIFTSKGDPAASAAWANALIHNGIVTNDLHQNYTFDGKSYSQKGFFSKTGYYMKLLGGKTNYYAIVLNTNLGSSNSNQMNAFYRDLKWIQGRGGQVVVLGHHPNVMQDIVPSQYRSMVGGSFAGHIHVFKPTDSNGLTVCPATTQAPKYSAFLTGDFDSKGRVKLTNSNMIMYKGASNKLPSAGCWL